MQKVQNSFKEALIPMKIIAQTIGIAAVVLYILSYQMKRRKAIIFVNATSSFLYVVQYIMLGAFEGAALDTLGALSAIGAANKNKPFVSAHKNIVIIIMNMAVALVGAMLYKNIFSLFSIAGAMLQMSALWITKEKNIRILSLAGAPMWLVYNFVSKAYGSAIGSLLSIISLGTAILRYDIIKKAER